MNTLTKPKKIQIANNVEYLLSDGTQLALHSWVPKCVKAVLFYIHGIQSHAAWSFEMAEQLANASIAVFVLDRRGAGLSKGLRGDIPSAEILLSDYLLALQTIKQKHPKLPLTLFGHSLGGSILAGLLSLPAFNIKYNAVVFCASALGKLHNQLTSFEQQTLLINRSLDSYELNLNDNNYTDDPYYLKMMAHDKLCCRKITHRARAALLEIENYYWKKNIISKDTPSVYVFPQYDPLININESIKSFMALSGEQGVTLRIPYNKHYLWFSEHRHRLITWLTHYVLTGGYINNADN